MVPLVLAEWNFEGWQLIGNKQARPPGAPEFEIALAYPEKDQVLADYWFVN
jgi:hypothetical protein